MTNTRIKRNIPQKRNFKLIGRFLAFNVPALQQMRELNHESDHKKMSVKRFREAVKVPPWTFGASALMRNLAARGLLGP